MDTYAIRHSDVCSFFTHYSHISTALEFIFEQQNSFVPLIAAFIAHIAELKVSASSRSFE